MRCSNWRAVGGARADELLAAEAEAGEEKNIDMMSRCGKEGFDTSLVQHRGSVNTKMMGWGVAMKRVWFGTWGLTFNWPR